MVAFSTLALVVHELMTNSAKYGGLSGSGRVDVIWELDEDGDIGIDWVERGGPPVKPPTRQGFGSTIISRSIPYDLGGKATMSYGPEGFEAHFCVPARHVGEGRVPPKQPGLFAALTPGSVADHPLGGDTVLLVEDSLVIALDAEDILQKLGAEKILAAATVRQARDEVRHTPPTIALLDVNLGHEDSLPIADDLADLGVPFMFATGYGEQLQLPERHAHVRVLQKPYTAEGIAAAVAELRAG